jgi:hypothetical protein
LAIFDLDGVIIANPDDAQSGPPKTCGDYWTRHWTNPDMSRINKEIVLMAQVLSDSGVLIQVLTARPERFYSSTHNLLVMAEFPYDRLDMLPGTDVPQSSAAWKQERVAELKRTYDVLFMIEDYRPNAEAVRSQVPVLLYERKKPSVHLENVCGMCGGLVRCLCDGQAH